MSRIKDYYTDEHGNWLPEAQDVLNRCQTQTTNNGTHTVIPPKEVGDIFEPPCERKVETP